MGKTYTHPDVFGKGVREGWADPETDPTRIDWTARQARAVLPFQVINGRPVNPGGPTPVRYGRNELGHWGEQVCADACVTAIDTDGCRWLIMVERGDGHGWALPGGTVDPGEDPSQAAVRELVEETGLDLREMPRKILSARYVPDPRASDEAWMVTVPARIHLGIMSRDDFPAPVGADDARRAEWIKADNYTTVTRDLRDTYRGRIFPAHVAMLQDLLG